MLERAQLGDHASGNQLAVPIDLLQELLVKAGAVWTDKTAKMNSILAENELVVADASLGIGNQEISVVGIQVLVEKVSKSEGNVIRDLMEWKGISLKDMAETYGGKSAASNLANFLAKPNDQLDVIRTATKEKIALALGIDLNFFQALIQKRLAEV